MNVLRTFTQEFEEVYERPPRIWFEKFCVFQDDDFSKTLEDIKVCSEHDAFTHQHKFADMPLAARICAAASLLHCLLLHHDVHVQR